MHRLFIWLLLASAANSLSAQVSAPPIPPMDVECVRCECVKPTQNLIKNGDFSLGNAGFASDLTYVNPGTASPYTQLSASQYTITTNANFHNAQWLCLPTSPTQFLIADGASTDKVVWRTSVGVQVGKKYSFCMRANNLQNPGSGSTYVKPKLLVRINGTLLIPATVLTHIPDQWQSLACTWTAPASATIAQIEIVNIGAAGGGNDFGIDDISFGLLPSFNSAFTVATNDVNPTDGFYGITATALNNTMCQAVSYSVCELSNPSNPNSCVGPTPSYVNVTTTNFPGFGGATPGKFTVGKFYRITRLVSCPCFQRSISAVVVQYAPNAKQIQAKEIPNFNLSEQELSSLKMN